MITKRCLSIFVCGGVQKKNQERPVANSQGSERWKQTRTRDLFSICLSVYSWLHLLRSGWVGWWLLPCELKVQLFLSTLPFTKSTSTSQRVANNTKWRHGNYPKDSLSTTKCGPELTTSIPTPDQYRTFLHLMANVKFECNTYSTIIPKSRPVSS